VTRRFLGWLAAGLASVAAVSPAARAQSEPAPAAAPAPASVPAPAPAPLPTRFDLSRPEISQFVRDVIRRDGFTRSQVVSVLRKAVPQARAVDTMNKAPERVLQWWEYRRAFVSDKRIAEGVQFWNEHRASLERIADEHGVAPEYIVAILGCETDYGRITGRDRVLDQLMTFSFEYPTRAEYFRSELEQFLLLVREAHFDPLTVRGSYAGAMGAPQFMPSAVRRYAIDEHDDKLDLWNDWDDIIASIANYFRQNGWQPGAPVMMEARLDPNPTFQLDTRSLDLNTTLDALNAQGVQVDATLPGSTPARLIAAEQQDGPAYRVGFANFRVITRYNSSARYAMAVHDLARSIAERVHAAAPAS